MELSDELLEQMGAYLSGKMTDGEKDQFETRLRQDDDLRQEVAIQGEIKRGLSFLAQKDRFRNLHADLDKRGLLTETEARSASSDSPPSPGTEAKVVSFPERRPTLRVGWARWVLAASLVLLLGFGWVFFQNRRERQQELALDAERFDAFFSPRPKPTPPLPSDPDRLGASPDDGSSNDASSAQDSVRLYAAVEALQRAELPVALRDLTALAAGTPGHWRASAQWYLALAYVRNHQRTEARDLLQTIAGLPGHPYQRDAQRLLSQVTITTPLP